MKSPTAALRLVPLILATATAGAWAQENTAKPKAARADATASARPAPATAPGQVRDWSKIDLNKDNLISPEEMEKWLAENPGPLAPAKK
ncbi:hypothetical protein BurJ1DRAFT_0561 [Burkholderiales bacterium JOSHI_001]|nr:hypothetical protein BurJ1DRAFT_0561 [Burkholderiales bacterium JOSHI_001]